MSAGALALTIVAAIVFGTIAFALVAVRRLPSDPQQYIVGGRSLGAVLMWVLMGGEIYTTFTFLGVAGWAYGHGAEAYYTMAYGAVAYTFGYFLLPAVWRFGNARKLLTIGDFFAHRYASVRFGALIGLGMACLEALNVTVQLTGLQILLAIAGYGSLYALQAVLIAFGLTIVFVFSAGLAGMAWASIVKDVLMLVCALGVGIGVPALFFGSPAAMLARAMDAHPASFVVGAFFAPQGKLWFITTVALTGLGYFMSAGSFAAIYAAKSEDAVRRNAMFLPLYGILVVPIFFAGYTALLVAPGLPAGPAADSAYLHLMQRAVPVPLVAVVCAAGCLAALVPSAARILAAASLVSKNVLGDVFGIARGDVQRVWVTRLLVVAVASLALLLWLNLRASLVDLLLYVYNGVTQLVPGVFFGLFWRRISLWPVAIGLVTGELVAASLTLHPQPALLHGTNPGFCALAINAAVTVGLALVMKPARARDVPA